MKGHLVAKCSTYTNLEPLSSQTLFFQSFQRLKKKLKLFRIHNQLQTALKDRQIKILVLHLSQSYLHSLTTYKMQAFFCRPTKWSKHFLGKKSYNSFDRSQFASILFEQQCLLWRVVVTRNFIPGKCCRVRMSHWSGVI